MESKTEIRKKWSNTIAQRKTLHFENGARLTSVLVSFGLLLNSGGLLTWSIEAGSIAPAKPGKDSTGCASIGIEYRSYGSSRFKCGFPTFINPDTNDPYLTETISETAYTDSSSVSAYNLSGGLSKESRPAACNGTFQFHVGATWTSLGWLNDLFYTNNWTGGSTVFASAAYNFNLHDAGYNSGSGSASPSISVVQGTWVGVRYSDGAYGPSASYFASGTVDFTPGAVGYQTKQYVDGICAPSNPLITGNLVLTPVVSIVNPISETVEELWTGASSTPAKQTFTLSDQYNTSKLISLATADLSACTLGDSDWGKGVFRNTSSYPATCVTSGAETTAYRHLSADEKTLGLQRLEYRIIYVLPRGESVLFNWLERQVDEGGNVIHDELKQAWLVGTGDVQYSTMYSISVPSVNSTISVVSPQHGQPNGCPCITGSTTAAGGKILVQSNLGKTDFGLSAGSLFINSTNPSSLLGTPLTLGFKSLDTGAEVISTNGALRQVKVTQGLADIITNTATQYQINFYTNAGTMSGGLYVPSGSSVSTMLVDLVGGSTNHVRFTISGMGADTVDYYWSDANQGWTTTKGNSTYTEQRLWNTNSLLETNIVYNAAMTEVARTKATYLSLAGSAGNVPTSIITDPSGAALTTQMFYINDTNSANHGRLTMQVEPDGKWEVYRYDSLNRITNIVRQFGDSVTNSADSSNRLLIYDYSSQGSGDIGTNDIYTPRLTTEKLLGQEIKRSYTVMLANGYQEIVCPYPGLALTNSLNEVTTTVICTNGTFIDRPLLITHPDGTITGYIYSRTSTDETVTVGVGQPDSSGTNVYNGTKTVTDTGLAGQINSVYTYRVQSGVSTLVDQQTYQYNDPMFRSHTITYLDGRTETSTYDCCGLASSTDKDGTETDYSYDGLHRQVATTKTGITQTNILDAVGRTLASQRIGTNGNTITLSQSLFDEAGRLIASTNALGGVTTYLTSTNGSAERVITSTNPDGGTRIETYFQDGNLKSITGTGIQPVRYEYGIESESGYYRTFTKEIKLDSSYADTAQWIKSYADGAGRTYKTLFAGSSAPYQQSWFNNKGQQWKQRDPDGVVRLTSYDLQGKPFYSAVDVNQNDVIDTNGLDRVSFVVDDVVTSHSTTVHRIRNYAHLIDNSGSFDLLSMSEQSVDGLQSWQTTYRDASTPVQESTASSYGSGGARTVTSTSPDGSYSISLYSYGVLQSVNRYAYGGASVGSTSYGYDAHGRASSMSDARNGTSSMTFNSADQVVSSTTPAPGNGQSAQTTTTLYDNMGRTTNVIYPDGTQMSREYFATSMLKKTYGSRTYPVEYSYDAQGRMATLKTWQNFVGNLGTNTTAWIYDSERGWMTNKVYSDGNGTRYTYSPGGRLKTRVWARGITTTYKYGFDDGGSIKHGDLTVTDYSDSTPDVTLAYDRVGRVKTVADVGSRSYVYNLASEATSDAYAVTTYGFGSTNNYNFDAYLRLAGITNVTLGLNHNYAYDSAGRLSTVSDGTNNVTYSYQANSSLPATLAFKQNTTLRMNQSKSVDNLNRLTDITSTPQGSGALPMSYNYTYNNANQRIKALLADGSYWLYTYDNLGQVNSGSRYWADSTPVAGQQFGYGFDDIGNRTGTTAGGDQNGNGLRVATYAANGLNEYTNRTVPGAYDIVGAATASSNVTVNGSSTYRKGEYFWSQVNAANGSGPLYQTNTVTVTGGSTVVGNTLVPPATQTFQYDLDGNLTNDALWAYVWDGENRLIQMSNVTTLASSARKKLDFTYDSQGRRFRKVVSTWNGSAWVAVQTNLFHYNGWNCLGDYVSASNYREYMWGNDLSGSLQGAGGVGGLIAVRQTNQVHFVAYDGNGNVAGLVNAADGTVSANYEYGPFGEGIRGTGTMAKANPLRWSTEYQDDESDLLYYGYRYYTTSTGRWLTRDVVEEGKGGPNLYSFVANRPLDSTDVVGLWATDVHHAIVDDWLPENYDHYAWQCCSIPVRQLFKNGSDTVDGIDAFWMAWPSAQSEDNAYQHAMRSPSQSVAAAEALYNQFMSQHVRNAQTMMDRARASHNTPHTACAFAYLAITELGKAYHSYSDSLSPAHGGFQIWYMPIDGVRAFGGVRGYVAYLQKHEEAETMQKYQAMKPSVTAAVSGKFQGVLEGLLQQ